MDRTDGQILIFGGGFGECVKQGEKTGIIDSEIMLSDIIK